MTSGTFLQLYDIDAEYGKAFARCGVLHGWGSEP